MYKNIEIGSYPFTKENRFGTSLVLRSKDAQLLKECKLVSTDATNKCVEFVPISIAPTQRVFLSPRLFC